MILIQCLNPKVLGSEYHIVIEAYDHDDKVRLEIPRAHDGLERLIRQLQNQLPKGE